MNRKNAKKKHGTRRRAPSQAEDESFIRSSLVRDDKRKIIQKQERRALTIKDNLKKAKFNDKDI